MGNLSSWGKLRLREDSSKSRVSRLAIGPGSLTLASLRVSPLSSCAGQGWQLTRSGHLALPGLTLLISAVLGFQKCIHLAWSYLCPSPAQHWALFPSSSVCVVLIIEPRALDRLGNPSTSKPHPQLLTRGIYVGSLPLSHTPSPSSLEVSELGSIPKLHPSPLNFFFSLCESLTKVPRMTLNSRFLSLPPDQAP